MLASVMSRQLCTSLALLCLVGCKADKAVERADETSAGKTAASVDKEPGRPDPDLKRDRDEYIADVIAFSHTTHDQVWTRITLGSAPLKDEWNTWEKQGPMTPDRIKEFYKQTTNYIYELAAWHLFSASKRTSDLALFEDLRKKQPRNILDFGGGVGLLAVPLAREGFDVTLADLDSTTLSFAVFHAQQRGVHLKVWKSDVEAAPPDKKYDVIMCMDVLEHLPKDVLHDVVDKLVKLKHAGTQIIISAPFGRTATHPMHMDLSDDTKQQIERLRTAFPDREG